VYEDVLREALLYDELMAILNSVGYGAVEASLDAEEL
jgi:hypothetical protein